MLNEDHLVVQATARRFAKEKLAPFADAWDETETIPQDVIAGLAQLGFLGLLVPDEWGGAGATHLMNSIVVEEIAAGCGGVSTMMQVHNLNARSIAVRGTDTQRRRYLPQIVKGSMLGCFCLTEPHAGSDTSMIRTRADRVDGGWKLNGTKCYISNGRIAGLATVLAVTDRTAGRKGITAFLVPTDTAGFRVGRTEHKLGQRCSDTVEIILQDCIVPEDAVLGAPNDAYGQAMTSLSAGRIAVAAQATGMARAAYAHALDYARKRHAYGKPIVEHQAISFRLASMLMKIEVAREYTRHAAALLDQQAPCATQASIAKCFASEMAERVCSDAISILGGHGYMVGSAVERIYRDVRVCQIYEGTSDMQRLIIGRQLDLATQ